MEQTHDIAPRPTFDKAWQREAYHMHERLKAYDDPLTRRRRVKAIDAQAKELDRMKAAHAPKEWITYEEAAELLGNQLPHIYRLAQYGDIEADRKNRKMSKSSVEAYRDTRRA